MGRGFFNPVSNPNTVDTGALVDDAVTNPKIADNAVAIAQMADNSVSAAEIVDGSVGVAEIGNDAVAAAEIQADAVGASEIAANAVGNSEMADNAIGSAEITDSSITSADIALDTIAAVDIAPDAVGSSEIATDAVDSAEIKADAVGSSEIATGAVGAAEVADGSLGTGELSFDVATQAELDAVVAGGSAISIVSALPGSPFDGQEIYYQTAAMVTAGVPPWHLRYNSGSASAYKWEVVGAVPWQVEVDTSQNTTSTTYAAFGDAISVTTPLAGDYYVDQGAQIYASAGGVDAYLSYSVGGTAATNADAILVERVVGTTGVNIGNYQRRRRKNAVASGSAIAEKVKQAGGGTATYSSRFLAITPIRVG